MDRWIRIENPEKLPIEDDAICLLKIRLSIVYFYYFHFYFLRLDMHLDKVHNESSIFEDKNKGGWNSLRAANFEKNPLFGILSFLIWSWKFISLRLPQHSYGENFQGKISQSNGRKIRRINIVTVIIHIYFIDWCFHFYVHPRELFCPIWLHSGPPIKFFFPWQFPGSYVSYVHLQSICFLSISSFSETVYYFCRFRSLYSYLASCEYDILPYSSIISYYLQIVFVQWICWRMALNHFFGFFIVMTKIIILYPIE